MHSTFLLHKILYRYGEFLCWRVVDGIVSADRHGPGQNEKISVFFICCKNSKYRPPSVVRADQIWSTDLFNMWVDTLVLRSRQSEGKGNYQKSVSPQMPDFSGHKRVTTIDNGQWTTTYNYISLRFTVTQLCLLNL